MITQKELKEVLNYNPKNGLFTWKIKANKDRNIGSVAGSKNKKGYVIIGYDRKTYLGHRLAHLYMLGEFPKNQIDHKDHIKHNNKWKNLREVTNQENHKNMTIQKNNKSGHIGVSFNKEKNKFQSYITVNNKKINLGYYVELNSAIYARKQAETKYNFYKNHGI